MSTSAENSPLSGSVKIKLKEREDGEKRRIICSSNYLPSEKYIEITGARLYSSKTSVALIVIILTIYISLMDF